MFEAGMISKVEKMAVDIVYSQVKRDYNSSINDASLANTLLQNLLSESETVTFSSSLFVTDENLLAPLSYFRDKAQANNSVLKIVDAKLRAADAGVRAQTADFMPSVYAFGSRELYKEDLTILDPVYSYGLGFSWSLFEGGSSVNKTKAALRQREAVRYMREKYVKDINTAVEFYYKKMQNAAMNYKAVQDEIVFTREFYAARELGFKAGTSTSLEVNMALTQRLKTELDGLNAQYDFVVSLANILSVSGETQNFEDYKKQSYQTEK
jgi:outer membrane protein TolC